MKENQESNVNGNQPWMVTLPNASKITGIPYGHLRKLVLSGELPTYRAGDRYYVWIEELRNVLSTK